MAYFEPGINERFLKKYSFGQGKCKECGKDIYIFLIKGQPHSVTMDLLDHEHAAKDTVKPLDEVRRETGGNHA
jgi:hypothetical protein